MGVLPVNPLEALADAIMAFEGWHVGSRSYRNRNPGNLRRGMGQVDTDPSGYAVFTSLVAGYLALIRDLTAKMAGRTASGLGPDSTLRELMNIYAPASDRNDPAGYAQFICHWMTGALGERVTPETRLAELAPPGGLAELPEPVEPSGHEV